MVIRRTRFFRRLWRAITASAQRLGEAQHVPRTNAILEPRQHRLRCQPPIGYRVASRQKLHHRILSQSRGIVAGGIPAGNTEQALLKQFRKRMGDL